MLKKQTLLLVVAFLFLALKNFAQKEVPDSVMNKVLKKMWDNNKQLIGMRGAGESYPYNKKQFTTADVLKTLNYWDYHRQQVGMLIYLFDDKENLSISYLNNANTTDTVTTTVSRKQLADLEKQLKTSIGAVYNESSTTTRGVKLNNQSAVLNTDSLVKIISNILLPDNFAIATLDHLVILPSANIAAFPFAMLLVNGQPLIDKMSYSIIPSINEFVIREDITNKNTQPRTRDSFKYRDSLAWNLEETLFIGNPTTPGFDKWQFKPLPGAEFEVDEISKSLKEKIVLKGKEATKANVLPNLSNHEIIYFATHAIADSTDPLNKSFLLLSGDNAKDAFLTTKEIQDLAKENPIGAFLVILSACETGLGKSHAGGMIGMSRAFMIAGAQNVLMSLWEISDAQTPVLMKYFFEYLENDGKPQLFLPYGALQKAIIRFKKENKNPRFWAAFSMLGITF